MEKLENITETKYGFDHHPNDFYRANYFCFIKKNNQWVFNPKPTMVWEKGKGIIQFAEALCAYWEENESRNGLLETIEEYCLFLKEDLKINDSLITIIKNKCLETSFIKEEERDRNWRLSPDEYEDEDGDSIYPYNFYGNVSDVESEIKRQKEMRGNSYSIANSWA